MKSRKTHLNRLAAALIGMLCAFPALADDSEIYLSTTTAVAVKPNILLIVDNSYSMNADDVLNEKVPYSRSTTYSTSGNCTANRIFFRRKGDPMPDCSSNNYFDSTASGTVGNNCDKLHKAAIPSQTTAISGRWTGKAAQWTGGTTNAWADLRPGNTTTDVIECQADDDVHGQYGGSSSAKYAQNGNASAKWTSLSTNRINWSQRTTYNFYSANWLNWSRTTGTTTERRITSVRNAVVDMVSSVDDVNMGFMMFNQADSGSGDNQYTGGRVTNRIQFIDTNRATLISSITNNNGTNNMNEGGYSPNSATPLTETLYEAEQYWSGGAVWSGGSGDALAMSGGNYISPITHQCQRNFTVILTDGRPTYDNERDGVIQDATHLGGSCDDENPGDSSISGDVTDGRCLDDLAGWMRDHDHSTLTGTQGVTTYTIGFGGTLVTDGGQTFLQDVANRGGGAFFPAQNAADLQEIFDSITGEALDVSTTFTSGAVSVNAFNRTFSRDEVYFSVFAPQDKYRWDGNIKKYKIAVVDPDGTGPQKPHYIFRGSGSAADVVDPNTGFFIATARSYWSTADDGANVTAGGAANMLPAYGSRRIYTHLATNPKGGTGANRNLILITDTTVNDTVLGTSATSPTRAEVLDFARSRDEKRMGDPMHSSPIAVTYGGTTASPIDVVYAATNDGYVHAFDANTGVEKWAFIPEQMLSRLKTLMDNPTIASRTSYGIDGDLRVLIFDQDQDGQIESGDKVYLYFGMRRGGKYYYGLDVTDRDDPKLLFKIGPPANLPTVTDSDLPGIGETWSPPTITRMLVGSGTNQNGQRLVLVFGGGYAATQEGTTQVDDTEGHRIFIVDAKSGVRLWAGGGGTGVTTGLDKSTWTNMKNSIPGSIVVQDLDGDQFADRMYAADTGGRIWRFDVFNGTSGTDFVTGGVFAALGQGGVGTPAIADTRRFYYAPDVTLVTSRGAAPYFNVAIGSGYRGHPLHRATIDRFYSLRDQQPFLKRTQTQYNSLTAITDGNTLVKDVTSNPMGSTVASTDLGWKYRFEATPASGEKIISQVTSGDGDVFFSTYTPLDPTAADPCRSLNRNRIYQLKLANGRPARDMSGDGVINNSDIFKEVEFDGILGQTNVSLPPPDLVNTFREACVASGYKQDCTPKTDTDGDGDIDANDSTEASGGVPGSGPSGGGLGGGGTLCNTGPIIHGSCLDGNSQGRIYWFRPADTGN